MAGFFFNRGYLPRRIDMHYYTVRDHSKVHVIFWISAISVLITPVVNQLVEWIVDKNITISNIYHQLGIIGISFSGVLIFTCLWFLFKNFIWKLFSKVLIPNISGHYLCTGIGEKYSQNDVTNNWSGVIEIEQSYDELFVKLTTEKSKSHSYSLVGDLEKRDNNEVVLSYMYENEPYKTEEGLNQHKGFCRLTFNLKEGSASGRYYTDCDRSSYGTMNLKKVE